MIDPLMLDLFQTEVATHAAVLQAGLTAAANDRAGQPIEPMVRAAHSLKGAARMLGLEPAGRLGQSMESILSAAQKGARPLSAPLLKDLERANGFFLRLASTPSAKIPDELAAASGSIEILIDELARGPAEPARSPAPDPASAARAIAVEPGAGTIDPALIDLFRLELETNVRILEEGLVAAEGSQSPEKVEPLMRAAHSIKGAARMVGVDGVVQLAHAMEDVLSAAQKDGLVLTSAHIDALLAGNDVFARLAGIKAEAIPAEVQRQRTAIEQYVRRVTSPDAELPAPAPRPVPTPRGAPALPGPATAARETPPERPEDGLVRVFADNLNRLIGLSGECLVQTESLKPLTRSLRRIKQAQTEIAGSVEQALEALRAGRAADALAKLEEAAHQSEQTGNLIPNHIAEFGLFSHRLETLMNRLYAEAVASRMRPFSDGVQGFPRMVRGLAKSLGKAVRLEIEGASTRVDRDILEKLESPLTHLLRNAVDHGLEAPAERLAAGKPEEGRLVLAARHSSGMLVVTISDDGSGIDCGQLRRHVVDAGRVPAAVARDLSNPELLEFLFLPGFTTRSAVSEYSGRGVGLDVVQSMVREVGGAVRVESTAGAGASFHLQLPLTLSVVRSMLIEIAGEFYAVPLARIDRVLRVPAGQAMSIENRQYCAFEGENVGIVDAHQILGLPPRPDQGPDLHILIVSDRLNRYGLVVDGFAGERDLVVVPFHPRLGKTPNLSAGAILEDGSPVLILDVEDVVRSIDNLLCRGAFARVGPREPVSRGVKKKILVVDDSLTVREVERRMLEGRGYEVALAVDGMDGWNALTSGRFDLLITDVDMPRMDGIELVRLVRRSPRLSGLPVMIVSYKDQEEYRIKGLQAGANHYLTKSSFHEDGLLTAVRDLIGEPQ